MENLLLPAVVAITFALAFYTLGVWAEHRSKNMKPWHVIMFWFGLLFDTTGTIIMSIIAKGDAVSIGGNLTMLHSISGMTAIALMGVHAFWATTVLLGKDENKKKTFHRFSIFVWLIWLIPYGVGMVMGML